MIKVRDFERSITLNLKALSFVKKQYVFVKKINVNAYGTLGFITSSYRIPGIIISPIVGVYFKQIEEVFKMLTGIDTVKMYQPIISTALGYVMPENNYLEWEYLNSNDIDRNNSQIVEALKLHGLPFMNNFSDEEKMLECVEEGRYLYNIKRDYYLPIIYYLRGQKEKGLEIIESSLERQQRTINESDIPTFDGASSRKIIISSGFGHIDPEYLKFCERYRKL